MKKREIARALWRRWAAMWNGDYSLANDIIVAKGFTAHLTDIGLVFADPIRLRMNSQQEVHKWVARIRNKYASLNYTTKAGPFIDIETSCISATWQAEGVFTGKTSMPNDKPGAPFTIVRTDILRFKNGKLYEYWALNSSGSWHV